MKRSVLGLDRFLTLLLALVLVVAGAAAIAWGAGWLPSLWAGAPSELDPAPVTTVLGAGWWGGVSLAAGIVLGLLALWWLLAHRTHHGVGPLRLPGSDATGPLTLDGSSAADMAAEEIAGTRGVRSARGRVITDRGELLADLSLTVEPDADLAAVAAATDDVMADLATVLGRDDVHARVTVKVARSARQQARVS